MIAIVTAGGTPQPGEPLYSLTQGRPKALLEVCQKPMAQWVLDALDEARSIDKILLVGLQADCGLSSKKPILFLPDQGSLVQNLRFGMDKALDLDPQASHFLSASSDVPAVQPQMIDWLAQTAMQTDEDAYYTVIERRLMEARYPGSRRSYTHLRDVEVCGGDIRVIRTRIGRENDQIWEKIIDARKNVLKQAALIGLDTLFLVIFRLITLQQAVEMVARRLHITGRAIQCPYAEIGMDVDKPFQLEIMRSDLARYLAT